MFDLPWITCFSLYHVSICLSQDDEITTRLTQLSELQREEIIGVRIFLSIVLALVSFSSLSTQLRGEIEKFDEVDHETEEQVSLHYQLFNPHFFSPLT
jgi:hypothetical protein